ncbi:molybdenum cofactor biosynthesis protein MoaE [Candidatus Poriferisocius sp.]|uniref:molybdenum cofactor biosynthesis protein MoaE n=1 Tax=Candidatus Poriferisocius sp. TaxID=3101276 RepID=UPI003B5A0049
MNPPETAEVWIGLSEAPLPLDQVLAWVGRPDCGGTVLFSGTARDHSEGRPGVSVLEYEAYEEQVTPRLEALAQEARIRWPDIGRVAMLHRVGRVEIGESAVVAAVSAPHREEAFAAARFCIDALKATVPIWKKEAWEGGESWGLEAQHIAEAGTVASLDGRYAPEADAVSASGEPAG